MKLFNVSQLHVQSNLSYVVTSIKQLLVLKGYFFLFWSQKISNEPLQKVTCLFSSTCQRQCELLPSLGIRCPSSVSDWSISKKSSLKPHGQMKRNLVGSIYGRPSIKIAHFVPIRHKHGCHRQFLFLIGQFLKKSLLLKPFDQININLVGSIYGRSSIKMLISSRSVTNMATTGESCF